jgi:hypothetical protein
MNAEQRRWLQVVAAACQQLLDEAPDGHRADVSALLVRVRAALDADGQSV